MLSYRHAFHAGNHADVLKHCILVACLRYLNQKDKAYWYIDTHAGAGAYPLDRGYATQNAEHAEGIGRLWARKDLPEGLADYLKVIGADKAALRSYPGSPLIARRLLRSQDRMRLFELHASDVRLLRKSFDDAGRSVIIAGEDGFSGLKAVLPPAPRRALVLVDPSYELKTDYDQVVAGLADALARFPGGTYVVWYPLLQKSAARRLPTRLKELPAAAWLNVSLSVRTPIPDGFGMHGSGVFVVNPPWTLPKQLEAVMPCLVAALGQDPGAAYTLEWSIP